ncbi:ShlB/FhaC/HecB family hemolysin secretion/activation protein [Sphingomonas tabacisoli]|uniref:ShlB/FhaC/HecB family hemolysin secretion/activation protein n=1 Tax=Sphingomonas tabacisoli TaxID=2249466 RepID=A0ABW4I460_9SPHN
MAALALAAPAAAQVVLDRADPAVIERDLNRAEALQPATPRPEVRTQAEAVAQSQIRVAPGAVIVESTIFANSDFTAAVGPYLGRSLGADELKELLASIAGVARDRGFLFATASIAPQAVSAGVLRVTLDEGRIDAVRSLGRPNAQVDAILRRLVGTGPVRRSEFERALLIAGDVAGVRVTDARYVRQNGFGILLVTVADDRASFAAQLDNRGSEIVGPERATGVAAVRGVIGEGDEVSVLGAGTPFHPGELIFAQLKYSAALNDRGTLLWSSASVGHTHPGGSLAPFNVTGDSYALATGLSHPFIRSRKASVWSTVSFKGLWLDQDILGVRVRRDRIVTAAAELDGAAEIAGGVVRGNASAVIGLPLAGVTHAGDPLASRGDGDARLGLFQFYGDWTREVGHNLSIRAAGIAQTATRPLLASQELGLGGRLFGRAYDENERSGETGVAGSFEARLSLPARGSGAIRRVQVYAFADAGYVGNARQGLGGGALYSAGGGLRLGIGRSFDGEAEIATPLGADRLGTGNRKPRVSFRLSARW